MDCKICKTCKTVIQEGTEIEFKGGFVHLGPCEDYAKQNDVLSESAESNESRLTETELLV